MRPARTRFSPALPFVCGTGVFLLLFSKESAQAGQEGVRLCAELIIPSLFPFFVLSSLLVALGGADLLGRALGGWMRPLFRLNGSCAAALVLGAVGGYPVGIRTAAQLYRQGLCTRSQAERLIAFCGNCGPAFLVGVAGVGIFGSSAVGLLLLGTHLAAALLVGLLFRAGPEVPADPAPRRETPSGVRSFAAAFPDCVRDAFSSTLNVCAFVILFTVLIRLADCSGLLPMGAAALSPLFPGAERSGLSRSLLIGFAEVSTGVGSLAGLTGSATALPLCAFLLGWGGLSVHGQSLVFLQESGLSPRPYLLGKLMQGLLAAGLTALLTPVFRVSDSFLPAGAFYLPPPPDPLRAVLLVLFCLAGLFFLLPGKKRLEKSLSGRYNKDNP